MSARKFKAKKISTPDGAFDSKKEYLRFCELKLMESDGLITDLQRQITFDLIPSQKTSQGTLRGIKYIADFVYIKDGETIVEDVKPTKNGSVDPNYKKTSAWHEYMLKKKLLLYVRGIEIKEV